MSVQRSDAAGRTSALFLYPASGTGGLVALFTIFSQIRAVVAAFVVLIVVVAVLSVSYFIVRKLPNEPLNVIAPKNGAAHW
jgi:hypothetical protein